jgi:hypothetical protein
MLNLSLLDLFGMSQMTVTLAFAAFHDLLLQHLVEVMACLM